MQEKKEQYGSVLTLAQAHVVLTTMMLQCLAKKVLKNLNKFSITCILFNMQFQKFNM